MGWKVEGGVFAWLLSQRQPPTKNRKSYWKERALRLRRLSFCKVENRIALSSTIEGGVFAYTLHAEASVALQSRTYHCASDRVLFPSFWALHASPSNHRPASCLFTYALLRFRKRRFHLFGHCTLRLLSFCKVEHTTALQKRCCFHLFGRCTLRRQTTGVFTYIILRRATQDLACQHTRDMKSMLRNVNKVANKIGLQKAFPTCWASLPSSVKPEMFGNSFGLGFSGEVFAHSV